MLAQLAKAAIYRPPMNARTSLVLSQQMHTKQHHILPAHFHNYHRLVDWPQEVSDFIHPNYVQVLTLPMQLDMMTQFPFPFKAFGLVHIANNIKVIKLPKKRAQLSLNTYFGNLYSHKRGIVFELHSEACENGEVAVKATSYYLARASQALPLGIKAFKESMLLPEQIDINSDEQTSSSVNAYELIFEEFSGRKYAKVSGDYNPIHLWPVTSRLFGFDKAIAHGMYSHAKALSVMASAEQYDASISHNISVVFKQAIELPSTTTLHINASGQENCLSFGLSSESKAPRPGKVRQHVMGNIFPM